MKVKRIAVAAAIGLLVLPLSAAAQESVGVRVGVSADPDQFLFGGHLRTYCWSSWSSGPMPRSALVTTSS